MWVMCEIKVKRSETNGISVSENDKVKNSKMGKGLIMRRDFFSEVQSNVLELLGLRGQSYSYTISKSN